MTFRKNSTTPVRLSRVFLFLQPQQSHAKPKTTSYIADQVDLELQLTDLQNMNGVAAPLLWGLGVAGGAMFAIGVDDIVHKTTGKTILDHMRDAYNSATGSSDQNDGCNVAPTGDGKGCTDRGLPI